MSGVHNAHTCIALCCINPWTWWSSKVLRHFATITSTIHSHHDSQPVTEQLLGDTVHSIDSALLTSYVNVVDPDVKPKQMVELAGAVTFKSARCTVVTSAVASSVAEPQGLVPGRVAFSTIVVLEALVDLGQVTVTCFLPIVAAATAASAACLSSASSWCLYSCSDVLRHAAA